MSLKTVKVDAFLKVSLVVPDFVDYFKTIRTPSYNRTLTGQHFQGVFRSFVSRASFTQSVDNVHVCIPFHRVSKEKTHIITNMSSK